MRQKKIVVRLDDNMDDLVNAWIAMYNESWKDVPDKKMSRPALLRQALTEFLASDLAISTKLGEDDEFVRVGLDRVRDMNHPEFNSAYHHSVAIEAKLDK